MAVVHKLGFAFSILQHNCLSSWLNTRAAFANGIRRSSTQQNVIFDRRTKQTQRNRAALSEQYSRCQYVKDEVAYRVADKVFDLTKFNDVVIDIGCGSGHIAAHMIKENVGMVLQCDMSANLVRKCVDVVDSVVPVMNVIADETLAPFKDNSADLVISSLSAHWINDLAAWFSRCLSILREDCPMIGAMFSSETLYELRVALQLAEMERLGGIGLHISPFVRVDDISNLMKSAGFAMITLDTDEVEVAYPNIFELLYDLQLMSESNALRNRSLHLRRDILIAADAIYRTMYARKDVNYPATFQLVSFIGWRPGPLLPKVARRGSQTASFKDISQYSEGKMVNPNNNHEK